MREVEVLRLLARGLSNKEIAERLFIAPKTVSNHVEHIYGKIDTTSRAAASLFAMQHGLLPEEEFPVRIPAAAVSAGWRALDQLPPSSRCRAAVPGKMARGARTKAPGATAEARCT